jgi:hypothetical protein
LRTIFNSRLPVLAAYFFFLRLVRLTDFRAAFAFFVIMTPLVIGLPFFTICAPPTTFAPAYSVLSSRGEDRMGETVWAAVRVAWADAVRS